MSATSVKPSYNGWKISYGSFAPVTGRWAAARFGVGLCAGTDDALKRMIDRKNAETRFRNNPDAGWSPGV